MCPTEYNEAETMEMTKRKAGRKQTKTRLLDIKNLLDSTGWTAEKSMDTLKIPQYQRTTMLRAADSHR